MAYPDPYSHTRPQQPHRPVSYNSEADYGEAPLQYPTYDASAAGGVVPVQGGPRPLSVGVAATPYTSYDVRDEKSFARNSQPGGAGLGDDRPMSQWTIPPPPKSTGILRMWRKENRASWVKGGGFRTFFRLFSCCFLTFIFLLISVILTILLWVRPPNIDLSSISIPSSNAVSVTSSGLTFDVNLQIVVDNPNWFSANFQKITAVARYPGNNTNDFGGGDVENIKFKGNARTTFAFPFKLQYSSALDPNHVILTDLISKCSTSPPSDITIDYTLTLALKIIAVTIKPSISSSATFQCPIDASDLAGLAGSLGG